MNEMEAIKIWLEESAKRLSAELAGRMFDSQPNLNAVVLNIKAKLIRSGECDLILEVTGDKPPMSQCDDKKAKPCPHEKEEKAKQAEVKADPKPESVKIPLSPALNDALNTLAEEVISRKKKE
jgi:hypothetical protein